jgi:hypothetical protein
LTLASDHIKNWNESTSSSSSGTGNNNNNSNSNTTSNHNNDAHTHNTLIHAETTSRLIILIQEVLKSLHNVEMTLKTNTELRTILLNIQVPIDLLELMDYTNINPDLYVRGFVQVATQQLIGLQRRKNALHALGTTIEQRLMMTQEQKKEQKTKTKKESDPIESTTTKKDQISSIQKRPYDDDDDDDDDHHDIATNEQPIMKKPRI